jgi:hypothetical protein
MSFEPDRRDESNELNRLPQLGGGDHDDIRALLRVVGPAVVLLGAIFLIVGIGNFFASFGSFEPPRYFWCAFVGMPLLAGGMAISKFAFIGAVTRYLADEVAPVGKDVVNYMAEGTQDAVRSVAAAVGEGLRGDSPGQATHGLHCPKCGTPNETTAKFCKACGTGLVKSLHCPSCGGLNDADARFCDHCGKPLA